MTGASDGPTEGGRLDTGDDAVVAAVPPCGQGEAGGEGAFRVTAGLVDLQVNGFAGVDFNDASLTPERLDAALGAMLRTGVTSCLPTLITADLATLRARFEALDRAVKDSRLGPLMVPGYHLEGPFLNAGDGFAGCHPPKAMKDPDAKEVLGLESGLDRPILLVTLAPERTGAEAFVRTLGAAGKVLAIGHSAADFETVSRAADWGVRMSTHLGNGLPRTMPKFDNPLFAQLAEDRLWASFIADGIHMPPFALGTLVRAKGIDRAILVTDAVSAACAAPGRHSFAGMALERTEEGVVREPGSPYLAGSSLCLDQAVRNVVAWRLAGFREALRMACANPRRLLAPALERHGATFQPSCVGWSEEGEVLWAQVGTVRHHAGPRG